MMVVMAMVVGVTVVVTLTGAVVGMAVAAVIVALVMVVGVARWVFMVMAVSRGRARAMVVIMALFTLSGQALMTDVWMSFPGWWRQAGVRFMVHFLVIMAFIIFGLFHFFLPPCLCPLIF